MAAGGEVVGNAKRVTDFMCRKLPDPRERHGFDVCFELRLLFGS